jgi:hypothetical protein
LRSPSERAPLSRSRYGARNDAAPGDRRIQFFENHNGGIPTEARIGHTLAVGERPSHAILPAGDDMRLHHDARDPGLAARDLAPDIFAYRGLIFEILATIAVTGIDHDRRPQLRRSQLRAGCIDVPGVVIRRGAAAQNDVTIGVARRRDDRRTAALRDREKMMRMIRWRRSRFAYFRRCRS